MRVFVLALALSFSLCTLQAIGLHVQVWKLQDRRRGIPSELTRLRKSYDQSIAAAVYQLRVRQWWMAALAILLCLAECVR